MDRKGNPSRHRDLESTKDESILALAQMLSAEVNHHRARQRDAVILYATFCLALSASVQKEVFPLSMGNRWVLILLLAVVGAALVGVLYVSRQRGAYYRRERQRLLRKHFEVEFSPASTGGRFGITLLYGCIITLVLVFAALSVLTAPASRAGDAETRNVRLATAP